jgi:hypothetical protein
LPNFPQLRFKPTRSSRYASAKLLHLRRRLATRPPRWPSSIRMETWSQSRKLTKRGDCSRSRCCLSPSVHNRFVWPITQCPTPLPTGSFRITAPGSEIQGRRLATYQEQSTCRCASKSCTTGCQPDRVGNANTLYNRASATNNEQRPAFGRPSANTQCSPPCHFFSLLRTSSTTVVPSLLTNSVGGSPPLL